MVVLKSDSVLNLMAWELGLAGGGGAVVGERLQNSWNKKQKQKNAMIQQRAATRSRAEDDTSSTSHNPTLSSITA